MHLFALWFNDQFLGIAWHPWKVVGWVGNLIFFSRFLVQWWATEKRRQVVVPSAFWWLSLVGSLILLSYALHRRDSVFIAGTAVSWVPYLRNLWIHRRNKAQRLTCTACGSVSPHTARYCADCGQMLVPDDAD
jgi:lipid-A-disaccharide synthase-like uncharacterized protein